MECLNKYKSSSNFESTATIPCVF